ncbi:unnamed protein product [Acanthoscelides obtectus]|uniref:Uncharacterized protein n=1 Tax=Acanthoscelides obtectus TaxID=200917 RepID=A0A9P0LU07_ACAOB|nr:unnamed protein product [Acanthoscelides obtectus]CAK1675452.1 hypothetical protein AOBTE_LOCUS30230 [Acanthoscelides obtectus]
MILLHIFGIPIFTLKTTRDSPCVTNTHTNAPSHTSQTYTITNTLQTRPNFLIGSRRRPATVPLPKPTSIVTSTAAPTSSLSTAAPLFSRPTRFKPHRKYLATTPPAKILESQVFASRIKPDNRFRFVPRKPISVRTSTTTSTTTTTAPTTTLVPETDQVKESSIQQSQEQYIDDQKDKTTELAQFATAVQKLQQVQPPTTKRKPETQRIKITTNAQRSKNKYRGPGQFLVNKAVLTTPQTYHTVPARLKQTLRTTTPIPTTTVPIATATFRITPNIRPQPFAKLGLTTPDIYQPIINPVYYDTVQPHRRSLNVARF